MRYGEFTLTESIRKAMSLNSEISAKNNGKRFFLQSIDYLKRKTVLLHNTFFSFSRCSVIMEILPNPHH